MKQCAATWLSISRQSAKLTGAVIELIRSRSKQQLAVQLARQESETALAVSNSTVRRSLRKLIKLGIIERIHCIHPVRKGLDANIYLILPVSR